MTKEASAPIATDMFNVDGGMTMPWVRWFQRFTNLTLPYVIAYAATITPNYTNGPIQHVVLTGNIAVNFPTGGTVGDDFLLVLIQDATGGRVITLNAGFKLGSELAYGDPSTVTVIGGYFMSATELRIQIFRQGDPV